MGGLTITGQPSPQDTKGADHTGQPKPTGVGAGNAKSDGSWLPPVPVENNGHRRANPVRVADASGDGSLRTKPNTRPSQGQPSGKKPTIAEMESRLREIDAEIAKTKTEIAGYDAKEAKAKAELANVMAQYGDISKRLDAAQTAYMDKYLDAVQASEKYVKAAKAADEAAEDAETATRILGGLKAVGGVIEGVIACPLAETGIGAVGCIHALDTTVSGVQDVFSGQPSRTMTHQAIQGLAALVLDEQTADTVGAVGDTAIGMGISIKLSVNSNTPRAPLVPRGLDGAIATTPISNGSLARLGTAIKARMIQLGIPEQYARGFWPFATTRGGHAAGVGSNFAGAGIQVERQVLGAMKNWPEWNAANLSTRVEAVIAHEWIEFNRIASGMSATDAHQLTVKTAMNTTLPISQRARELLATMPMAPEPIPLPVAPR